MSITATGISHRYRRDLPPVLRDVNLVIEQGDTVAITGPSGSGKTTLLAILGGLLEPGEGSVAIDGVSVSAGTPSTSKIGWVFQTTNALGRRAVLDNVALPLVVSHVPRREAERAATLVLDRVGLGHRLLDKAAILSGGELQRLCIARALVTKPQVLLADEPTGQLDEETSNHVLDMLWSAIGQGLTLIVATHDPLVATRCSRVLRLSNGRLQP